MEKSRMSNFHIPWKCQKKIFFELCMENTFTMQYSDDIPIKCNKELSKSFLFILNKKISIRLQYLQKVILVFHCR